MIKIIKVKETPNAINLSGDVIESFERVERISEIILLGEEGGIRRIILE